MFPHSLHVKIRTPPQPLKISTCRFRQKVGNVSGHVPIFKSKVSTKYLTRNSSFSTHNSFLKNQLKT